MSHLPFEKDMAVRQALADLHDQCFKPVMKVTLVARHPTDREAYLICGDDDHETVSALLSTGEGHCLDRADSVWAEENGFEWSGDGSCMVKEVTGLMIKLSGDLTEGEGDTHLSLGWEYHGLPKVGFCAGLSDNPTRWEVMRLIRALRGE